MHQLDPYFREAGTGPAVVCTRANASNSGQWRALMELLAPKFHVFASDSYDAGKSPRRPSDRVISLRDEVALIEPVLARAGSPLALVGHSYGAVEALRALDVPVLYMTGKCSTASARGVARLLTRALPRVEVVEFDGIGHMGPVTHPGPVNEAIARFLDTHS